MSRRLLAPSHYLNQYGYYSVEPYDINQSAILQDIFKIALLDEVWEIINLRLQSHLQEANELMHD